MTALRLDRATARLGGRMVLEGVNLSVAAGELVALVGPNGAGKSTAIRALAGLAPLTAGHARLQGEDVHALTPATRARRAAYLPQERRIAWNMPAIEVAALGIPEGERAGGLARARAALADVEAAHLADRGVADMSGGERARVLLARALAADADALMLDEPIAGLDPDAQLLVLGVLQARARAGRAVLVSLHDLGLAARRADRVVVLDQGRVVADGAPLDALTPTIMARVFRLSAQWMDGPDGPLLASGRYSDGSAGGVVSPVSPAE